MRNFVPLPLGAFAGVIIVRERRRRKAAERLAAATLETLLNAIEANDHQTGMHVRRVAAYALVLAEALGFDEHEKRAVERVALFHDIGKIHEALFDITHEPTRLTPSERRAIATHPLRGAEVLAPLAPFYPELPAGVLCHHERWDGTGYPSGLRGKRIPLTARVVSLADTFDAVAQDRRYRRGAGFREAARVIAMGRGTQFDPALVDLMLLPPVLEQLEQTRVEPRRAPRSASDRREANEPGAAPDVSFRWRSESLGTEPVASVVRQGDGNRST
jgi:putative nucleotidyltransferase with HDIG domain